MKTLTVELETVTPLFLAGAEPRGTAELRAPAFRGAMRYWLRAIAGQDYREIEARVYGDTKASGLVSTRISGGNTSQPFNQKTLRGEMKPCGYDYLYWSMKESGHDANYQRPHEFIPEGSKFNFHLGTRRSDADSNTAFDQACVSLWLLLHLGGIGSRSRRTAGSIRLGSSSPSDVMNLLGLKSEAKDVVDYAGVLSQGIAAARQLMGASSTPMTIPSEFDVLQPEACRIWVLKGNWRTNLEAINGIGGAMRDFRAYSEPDHANVAPWLQGHAPPAMKTVNRAVFGLPLPFRYSNGGPSGTVQGRRREFERRASPLWLHISKLTTGEHVGVATLFKSAFLPKGEKIYNNRNPQNPLNPPEDYSLIEQFIDTFKRKEVTL